jgi:hypothetical protein
MKRFILVPLFLTLSFPIFAQMTPYTPKKKPATPPGDSREGLYGGISLGWSHYRTSWYYYRSDGNPRHDNYPIHSINRLVLAFDLEKRSVWKTQNLHFDLGGELGIGLAGKAKGIWLPDDDVISSGGWSAGLNAYVRAVYVPSGRTGGIHVYPFLSLGPQFTILYNNGKNTGSFASKPYYGYTDGWSEYLTMLVASIGADFQFDSFVLTPEFRFGLFGGAFTNWEPNEGGVDKDGGPSFTSFSLRLSKRF